MVIKNHDIVSMKPRTFVRSSVSIGSNQLSKNFSSATLASAAPSWYRFSRLNLHWRADANSAR